MYSTIQYSPLIIRIKTVKATKADLIFPSQWKIKWKNSKNLTWTKWLTPHTRQLESNFQLTLLPGNRKRKYRDIIARESPTLGRPEVVPSLLVPPFHCLLLFPLPKVQQKPIASSSLPPSMEDYYGERRYGDGTMQMESYYGPPPSRPPTSYAQTQMGNGRDLKLKKGKGISGSFSKSWSFGDRDFQRKKRLASYKMYSVEGKMKGSLRRSFRWLKYKYTQVVYGWWWFCVHGRFLHSYCMLKVLFGTLMFCVIHRIYKFEGCDDKVIIFVQ